MSAPRAGTKYISKRYGYEIVLRGKYTMYPATGQWDGGFPFGASGKVDLIVDDTQDGKFAVAAKPVPSGCRCHDGKPSLCACNDNIATGCDISGPRLLAAYPAREFVNA